jgi:hypothetical protein
LQVEFSGVGQLVRNRAGRIEFVFDSGLVEALELGVRPVSGARARSACEHVVHSER